MKFEKGHKITEEDIKKCIEEFNNEQKATEILNKYYKKSKEEIEKEFFDFAIFGIEIVKKEDDGR